MKNNTHIKHSNFIKIKEGNSTTKTELKTKKVEPTSHQKTLDLQGKQGFGAWSEQIKRHNPIQTKKHKLLKHKLLKQN